MSAPRKRRLLPLLLWVLLLGPLVAMVLALLVAGNSDLPGTADLENPRSDLATTVLFSDGSLMGQYYRQNRIPVHYNEISPYVVDALIATEDERFRIHSGIDLRGTARAALYMGGKGGASTITQQLAKMLFTEKPASSFRRVFQKLQEWIIAVQLERQYTKDEIIAMYLNRFDWINQAVGIHSASRVYFNTTPDSLRIEQAAMLVGMCKNPALFNPVRRPDTTLHRRMVVLSQMERAGLIDRDQYDSLRALPLGLKFQRIDHAEGLAPYFREVLRGKLQEMLSAKDEKGKLKLAKADGTPYDLYTDGLRVYTTLDRRMQSYGEWAMAEHLRTDLQVDFFRDLSTKKNRPFDWRVSQEEITAIMESAMKRSKRYRGLVGKVCPSCDGPSRAIEKGSLEGRPHYHCRTEMGGCDNWWPVRTADQIRPVFDEPVPMRVFSWRGEVDTVMSPMDSIRYYKSYLQSGLYSVDPTTGFVKAWVGGIDFRHFQYDHVEQSRRQAGSTFKPFVYATALREGIPPCKELPNQRVCFDMPYGRDWCPKNSDGSYGGMVTLRYALANSINTITAWLMKQYSAEAVTVLARHLGVKSPLKATPSLCLGVADVTLMEMTSAFGAFANKGVYIEPVLFTRIEDKNGNAIYDVAPRTEEALDEHTAYVLLSLMKGAVDGASRRGNGHSSGTAMRLRSRDASRAGYANIQAPTAAKTGTTQNNSDGWFIGITPELVTGVWTGAEDRSVRFSSTYYGQGANMALPIYGYYMNKVYADPVIKLSQSDFEAPVDFDASVLDCGQRPKVTGDGAPVWE